MLWRWVAGLVRVVGFVVLGVWAATVFFTTEIEYPEPIDRSPSIAAALEDYRANAARTDSAPQQDVVNGWVARDLLETIAKVVNEANITPSTAQQAENIRLALLVTIAILAVCWHGLTMPFIARPVPPATPATPPLSPAPASTPVPARSAAPTPATTVAAGAPTPPQPPAAPSSDGDWTSQWNRSSTFGPPGGPT